MPSGDLEKFVQAFDSVRNSFQIAMNAFNELVVQIEDGKAAGAQRAVPLRKLTGECAGGADSGIYIHRDYSADLVL